MNQLNLPLRPRSNGEQSGFDQTGSMSQPRRDVEVPRLPLSKSEIAEQEALERAAKLAAEKRQRARVTRKKLKALGIKPKASAKVGKWRYSKIFVSGGAPGTGKRR